MIRDLVSLQERMNKLFDEAFPTRGRREEEEFFGGMWSPAVDVYEEDNATIIKADLPGIDPENLDVRVENNRLIIRGERKMEHEVKKENFRQMERSYGSFVRAFTLPPNIKSDQIEASYKNGELRLTLPKGEGARSKRIQVSGEGQSRLQQKPAEERELAGAGTGKESRR